MASVNDVRADVGEALRAALAYATALWDHSVRWLRSVEVAIRYAGGEVTAETKHGVPPRFPREKRDPGPFLARD
jgi:hypothetical protein